MKKYFDILELDESATMEAVERAYQELTRVWRPENFQNLPRYRRKAETKLKQINEAYERLTSYLAAGPRPAATPHRMEAGPQTVNAAPQPPPPGSEPEPAPKRPLRPPPWEPAYPKQPDREHIRSRIQKTAQKSLLFGFVAVIAVLAVLLIYRVVNRQPSTGAPTPLAEKGRPAVATAQLPAAADRPEKAPIRKTPSASDATQPHAAARADTRKQTPPAAAAIPDRIDYQKALSKEALGPYNRNASRVRRIQKSLIAAGYATGPADGIIGPLTATSLRLFAADHHLGHDHPFAPDLASAVMLYAEVAAEHPDWHQIITSNEFVSWLGSQTHYGADRIQALKSSATARQLSDIVALYKSERRVQTD